MSYDDCRLNLSDISPKALPAIARNDNHGRGRILLASQLSFSTGSGAQACLSRNEDKIVTAQNEVRSRLYL